MTCAEVLTLGELYRGLSEQFATAGVPEPEVSARRIAAQAGGCSAAGVVSGAAMPLTKRMVAHADAMAARRAAGEPLQYVLGSWGFRRLELAVDQRALIPRPETETVAGIAIDWLAAAGSRRPNAVPNVADLGTGCGAIALSIAHEVPAARVFATDSSHDALALAASNLAGVASAAARITLHHGDWFEALATADLRHPETGAAESLRGRLDLVISNPPYVADGDVVAPEVRDWEPHSALYAGPDGLSALRTIVRDARGWLAPGGLLVLELAATQSAAVAALASSRGYDHIRIEQDLAGLDRALVASRPRAEPDEAQLRLAAERLSAGDCVVAPTDTLCGIMARYGDAEAVARVCDIKRRPRSEPMPILVSGLAQAEELVELNEAARTLARRHWPGGLTLVAERRGGPDPLHGRETLGVRVPDLGWLRWLIDEVGPVTGTSANRHGLPTPADAAEAAALLFEGPSEADVPGRIIAGRAPGGTASTVVDVTADSLVVLRAGAVRAELLEVQGLPRPCAPGSDSQGPVPPTSGRHGAAGR
ncbi:peptide chain release factor N(5)-glutamine methyltransferase [Candidatus Poriferisodalis sp.]|uniref:peptide chain release factor N(5)-glutamine methyltransferase n=1 Tax=Candidatus Poriferisodalis sp. TaxID=3101277 RepID=UPI003B022B01